MPEGKGNGGLSHSVHSVLIQEQTMVLSTHNSVARTGHRAPHNCRRTTECNSAWFPEVSWTGNSQWIALSTQKAYTMQVLNSASWSFWFSGSEWNLGIKVDLKTLQDFRRGSLLGNYRWGDLLRWRVKWGQVSGLLIQCSFKLHCFLKRVCILSFFFSAKGLSLSWNIEHLCETNGQFWNLGYSLTCQLSWWALPILPWPQLFQRQEDIGVSREEWGRRVCLVHFPVCPAHWSSSPSPNQVLSSLCFWPSC